jgi:tetratricopeptide (TPR) repeat protein
LRKHTSVVAALAVMLAGTVPAALAQSSYSMQAATALGRQGNWRGELAYGLGWVKAEPNNPDAWFILSTARENLGQLPGAIEAGKRAIQLKPAMFPYWYPVCQSYMGMGTRVGYQQLARDCAAQLQRLAQFDWQWFLTGTVYYSLAELQPSLYQNAKAAYLQDLKLNPKAAGAWQNLGNTEWKLGNRKSAEDDFQKAIELGNTGAAQNLRSLQQEIQSCFNQKQTLANTQRPMLGTVQNYNQNCGSISGSIPIKIVPVP